MIKKVILAASICISVAACSDSKSGGGNTPPPDVVTNEEITDTSMCSGRTPVDTNLYSNKWVTQYRGANGVALTQVYDFNHGRAVVTFSAKYKDQSKRLRVYTNIEERGRYTLLLGESEEVSDSIMVDGKPFRFSLVFSKLTVNYRFSGPCLVFSDSKHSKTFAPYRR